MGPGPLIWILTGFFSGLGWKEGREPACKPGDLKLRSEWVLTKEAREKALARRHQIRGSEFEERTRVLEPLEFGSVVQIQRVGGPVKRPPPKSLIQREQDPSWTPPTVKRGSSPPAARKSTVECSRGSTHGRSY